MQVTQCRVMRIRLAAVVWAWVGAEVEALAEVSAEVSVGPEPDTACLLMAVL